MLSDRALMGRSLTSWRRGVAVYRVSKARNRWQSRAHRRIVTTALFGWSEMALARKTGGTTGAQVSASRMLLGPGTLAAAVSRHAERESTVPRTATHAVVRVDQSKKKQLDEEQREIRRKLQWRRTVDQSQARAQAAEQRCAEAEGDVAALRWQAEEAVALRDDAEQKREWAETESEQLRLRLHVAESNLIRFEEQQREERRRWDAERQGLEGEAQRALLDIHAAAAQIEQLTSALQHAQGKIASQHLEMEAARAEADTLRERVEQQETALDAFRIASNLHVIT